jgi:hypothetical protein
MRGPSINVHRSRFTFYVSNKMYVGKGGGTRGFYSLGRSLLHSLAIIYYRKLLDTMKN